MSSKRTKNLAGKKRRRSYAKNKSLAMDIATAADTFVAPSPYTGALRYLPSSQKVTLRYSQKFTISASLAQAGTYVFRANSMYDPDLSGSGHQPRGFDQLMSMYDHFQVIGAKITIMSAQPSIASVIGVCIKDDSTVSTDYEDYFEENAAFNTIGMVGNDGEPMALKLNYSQKKFFGQGSLEEQYEGSVAANPAEGAFFHVYQTAITDTATSTNAHVAVIDYIAVLTEPKQPTKS